MNFVQSTMVALAVTLAVSTGMAANAAVSYHVYSGENQPIVLRDDQEVLLHVENYGQQPMQLVVPELKLTYQIPPSSQDTYYVDLRTVSRPETSYIIQTPNGQTVSSGQIVNTQVQRSSISLNNIINYSTRYTAESKPEPVYFMQNKTYSTTSQNSEMIRGLW